MSETELHLAISDWRKRFGFVRADRIDSSTVKSRLNTARYIGNYTNKGHFETPLVEQKKVLPVFRLMSKGLGKSYVDKHKDMILNKSLGGNRIDDIIDKLNYNLNGFNYSLPRYYKDKILPPKTRLRSKVADTLLARNDETYCDKLRAISATQNIDESKASTVMALSEIDALRQRASEVEDRQSKVLKKSKI